MSFSVAGTLFVPADRADVWAALHDVAVIRACIPGCCSLQCASERVFTLQVRVPLGPKRSVFGGTVEITASTALCNYRLSGSGKGPMGCARGTAQIELTPQNGGCRLAYDVLAEVHGPLRTIGSMVLTGAGKAIAMVFAKRFAHIVGRAERAPLVIAHQ